MRPVVQVDGSPPENSTAATMLIILSLVAALIARCLFGRRCSISLIISFKSAIGRISIGPSPYLKPGSQKAVAHSSVIS